MSTGVGEGELVGVLGHQVGQPVQQGAALGEAHPRPGPLVEGAPGRGHGAVDLGLAAQRDLGVRRAREGVDRVEPGSGLRLDVLRRR